MNTVTKKNKKNKKGKKVWAPLSYDFQEIHKVARAVVAINPYMGRTSSDAMAKDIEKTIVRAFNDRNWFVATAGWFAIFDRWEDNTFVDLYVSAEMTFNKLQTHGLTPYLPPAERAEAAKAAMASRGHVEQSTAFNEVVSQPSHTYWPHGPQ